MAKPSSATTRQMDSGSVAEKEGGPATKVKEEDDYSKALDHHVETTFPEHVSGEKTAFSVKRRPGISVK
uniref:Uncharacterized protein n=1 Tax=Oryza meridionalis TaxID=40149 RepID=A0A0E0C0V8_9ORYZ